MRIGLRGGQHVLGGQELFNNFGPPFGPVQIILRQFLLLIRGQHFFDIIQKRCFGVYGFGGRVTAIDLHGGMPCRSTTDQGFKNLILLRLVQIQQADEVL